MSGVLGHRLGRKYSRTSVRVSSVRYWVSLPLGVAPGEVVVGLAEAQFGQAVHRLGAGEGLGEKKDLRIVLFDVADQPFPEMKGLGVGVINPKNANSLLDPEADDAVKFFPELLPILGLEVKGINVFILFRRVFRILHGIVRPPAEPVGMLPDIRVVRRPLEGNIQGHFQVKLPGPGHKMPEIL